MLEKNVVTINETEEEVEMKESKIKRGFSKVVNTVKEHPVATALIVLGAAAGVGTGVYIWKGGNDICIPDNILDDDLVDEVVNTIIKDDNAVKIDL